MIEELGRVPADAAQLRPWQGSILIASSILGVLVVIVTEGLSAFHALKQLPLAVAWLAVAALAFIYGHRRNLLRPGWSRAVELLRGLELLERVVVGFFFILVILVLSVALASPPNNVDALQYHMPRVMHWLQDASLSHFATPYNSQNSRPYWAELVILNLRVLWGSDQPVNLPQAFSLIGIVIAATGMARLLGGSRHTQILAGALAFSVPMALLQASTPKNDVVSSFWVASTAYFVIGEDRNGLTRRERWALFASVALALLTKGTGIPFVAALLLWYAAVGIRRRGIAPFAAENAAAVLVVILLNGPFWYRNIATYGGPYGSRLPVVLLHRSEQGLLGLGGHDEGSVPADSQGLAGAGRASGTPPFFPPAIMEGAEKYLARWARMMAMHFVTPLHGLNTAIFREMRRLPAVFPNGYVTSLELAAWNHEMTAGNPLHVVLIAGAFGCLIFSRRARSLGPLLLLALAACFGLFLLSFAKCIDSVFCMRYQLSFFQLTAPVMAVVLYRVAPRAVGVAAAVVLVYAIPYVLFNNMRPVVGIPPWPTRIGSVFTEDVDRILFAQSPEKRDEYEYVAARVLEAGCRKVGLVTSRYDLEYTLWRLLHAPESGVEVQHLRATRETENYIDPGFSPCAVICTDCGRLPAGFDMPLATDLGHVRLYLRRPD